ncbi:MAG: serine/threonine protein kinase, partial [Cyanobacteria bacterium P01_C01_bin.38]
ARRSPATDVYGLASTLYALLTAQVPMPVLLRDKEKMPSPRELQPHLSASVNQAVMRGMAVEARFRPQTIEEWLDLLPDMVRRTVIKPVATHGVATIDLSTQDYEPPTAPPPVAVENPYVSPASVNEESTTDAQKPWFNKVPSPRALISAGVAIFGVTLGFGLTKIASTAERQPKVAPVNEAAAEVLPSLELPLPSSSPSSSPSASPSPQETQEAKQEKTPPSLAPKKRRRIRKRTRIRNRSAASYNPKRRRRSSTTSSSSSTSKKSSTTKTSSPSKTTPKKSTSSQSSSQSTKRKSPKRSNTSGASQRRRSTTTKPKKVTPPKKVKVVPSPSLVERLRRVRDSRNDSSSPKNSVKLKPAKKPSKPVVVPAKPARSSNAPAVVVPTNPQ